VRTIFGWFLFAKITTANIIQKNKHMRKLHILPDILTEFKDIKLTQKQHLLSEVQFFLGFVFLCIFLYLLNKEGIYSSISDPVSPVRTLGSISYGFGLCYITGSLKEESSLYCIGIPIIWTIIYLTKISIL